MGETLYHQGRDGEAFTYFQKVAGDYPGSEFYEYGLYSAGWIQFKKDAYGEGHRFFHEVHEKSPKHP